MSPVRARARRGEGEKLREEILAAASELLDETQEVSAVSIRAIAERVGVTPPSIYRHFADKEELLGAVCAEVFAQLQVGIAEAVAGAKTSLDALTQAGRCYVEFGLAHPEHYRLVFMRPPFHPEHPDHSDFREAVERDEVPESHLRFSGEALAGTQAFAALFELVKAVLAEVPVRKRPDPFAMTTTVWMSVHGITSLRITKPDFVWPSLDDQIDALMWPWRQLQAARSS